MAARRVSKSAINWTAFGAKVPDFQQHAFRALKAKSDSLVTRVHKHPEALPAINWEAYKAKITTPGVVEALETAYMSAAAAVPYPTDAADLKSKIDAKETEDLISTEQEMVQVKATVDETKAMLALIDTIPPPDEMSHQMSAEYFPDQCRNPSVTGKPTIYPHRWVDQPGNTPMARELGILPEWLPQPANKFRPNLSIRAWEPMNHEEEYVWWSWKQAQKQLAELQAQLPEDAGLQAKVDATEARITELRAQLDAFVAEKKKNEKELDEWRAAGCP